MRIACVATKGFEDSELAEPIKALRDAGHDVDVIGPKKEEISGYHGKVTLIPAYAIAEVDPSSYDALFVPGGFSPDQLRADDRFVDFVEAFGLDDKPIFAICHGPQLLFTAGVLDGRRCTAWKTVQHDLRRAGIDVTDEAVVEDGNLVTSRQPGDIAAFNEAIVALLEHGPQAPIGTVTETAAETTVH